MSLINKYHKSVQEINDIIGIADLVYTYVLVVVDDLRSNPFLEPIRPGFHNRVIRLKIIQNISGTFKDFSD